ncbi:UNVERIFIED_CONTAM: hypothetical protein Sradi_5728000 [Sesamum radiatum]|uniref:Retrotransposon gag domain-containing protein n=1 Tax=Sesamum radiatum TaxID=300843 RepID=A0AAW2L3Q6_SESRA
MAQNSERTIKEMTSLDLNQQPLCIEYPTLDVDFELKTGLIRLLPTFRGLAGEDPHKHLKEFHVVCSSMRPQGVTEEQVKLRAFPFSLSEKAKDWLYSLPSGSIVSWNELKKQFLENYFPASRTITIRKEISGIRQFSGKNFHEYWGRFKQLVESCPHHQIPDHLLIQYFYEGLTETNRSLVDAASGGALYDKTPTEARKLITTMAFNTQQFGSRNDNPPQRVNEDTWTCIQNLENQTRASIQNLESQHPKVFVPKPPFPERFANSKKENEEKEILETLHKVEVNILLLNAIKQVPHYSKFLKDLCTNKPKLRGNERVSMGENISAILQRKLPPKCKDPGTFSIPCIIGNVGIENAMCDLGASINVMPLTIYESLNIGPLKETGVVLQLADRSIVYLDGVLEDVLVQINELVFSADFYVLDMTGGNSLDSTSILLGRPFLKTSRTKIDIDAGILSMEFDNEVVKVNKNDQQLGVPTPNRSSYSVNEQL